MDLPLGEKYCGGKLNAPVSTRVKFSIPFGVFMYVDVNNIKLSSDTKSINGFSINKSIVDYVNRGVCVPILCTVDAKIGSFNLVVYSRDDIYIAVRMAGYRYIPVIIDYSGLCKYYYDECDCNIGHACDNAVDSLLTSENGYYDNIEGIAKKRCCCTLL